MSGFKAGTVVCWLVASGCSEYGMSRYPVPDVGVAEPGSADGEIGTPAGPTSDEGTDPEPGGEPVDGPDDWELCAIPGLLFPVVEHWEPATVPRTLTVLLSEGNVLVEAHEGPLVIDVSGVAPPSAGPVWSGDHLVLDFLHAMGAQITVRVPPEVERVEVGVCIGDAVLRGLGAEVYTRVEVGDVWGDGLVSPRVEVDNPLGETTLTFDVDPAVVVLDGGDGNTSVGVPSATCDCDLQVSGPGQAQLDGIVDDGAASVEVTAHRTIGTIVVRGGQ